MERKRLIRSTLRMKGRFSDCRRWDKGKSAAGGKAEASGFLEISNRE